MLGLIWWLFSLPRAAKPAPYLPAARYSPTLRQIKAWNDERLDIRPALNRKRA